MLIIYHHFFSSFAIPQKPGVGEFISSEDKTKVFYAALEAIPAIKFSVKDSDKENGVIQAEQYIIGGGGKVVNLYISIKDENGKTVAKATMTKPFGTTGKLSKFIQKYGEEIQKTIPDLEIKILEQKKRKKE